VSSLDADGKFLVTGDSERGLDDKRILIVRKAPATFLVMSMECTHQQCEVQPPVNNAINCLCHGSRYNLDGDVTAPQIANQAPLKRYQFTYDAARSIITIPL
ncbi:MAG: Rieske 2Fe-2S domain-containing protein, partial [bacterium]|nr:Rieske 2Fe-2S domain-containing protein [Candidatus Kapabacteria bacterium]